MQTEFKLSNAKKQSNQSRRNKNNVTPTKGTKKISKSTERKASKRKQTHDTRQKKKISYSVEKNKKQGLKCDITTVSYDFDQTISTYNVSLHFKPDFKKKCESKTRSCD